MTNTCWRWNTPFSTCGYKHKQRHTESGFSAHFHGFYVHQDKCTPCMLIGLSAGCDLWCMASLRALISQMAFEFAKLSCDHLEITGNQYCSDGALILANNGINENEIRAAVNGGRWTHLTELWNHNKYTALCLFFLLWTHQCMVQRPWRQGWLFLAWCHNIYQHWGGLLTFTLCPLMIILLLYFTSNSGGEITASLCSAFVLVVALHYIVNNTVRVFMKLLFVCVANSYGFHWAEYYDSKWTWRSF